MKTTDKTEDAQGVEIGQNGQMEIKADKIEETPKPKKKQATSVTYTLTALGENIRRLGEADLITEEQKKTLDEIREEIATKWIKRKMGM